MAKKKENIKYETEEILENAEKITSGAEEFLQKNGKLLSIGFGVLLIFVLGYFLYNRFLLEPKEEAVFENSITADNYFDQDSLALALDGKGYLGYKQIVEKYSSTAGGNLAKYKAAIASFKLEEYKKAFDYIESFKTDEEVLSIIRLGIMGDCKAQMDKAEEALGFYKKAAAKSEIVFVSAYYFRKAILQAMNLDDYTSANSLAMEMKEKMPEETQDANFQKLEEYLKYKVNGN